MNNKNLTHDLYVLTADINYEPLKADIKTNRKKHIFGGKGIVCIKSVK